MDFRLLKFAELVMDGCIWMVVFLRPRENFPFLSFFSISKFLTLLPTFNTIREIDKVHDVWSQWVMSTL